MNNHNLLKNEGCFSYGDCNPDSEASSLLLLFQTITNKENTKEKNRKDSSYQKDMFNSIDFNFNNFVERTNRLDIDNHVKWWKIFFRFLFYLLNSKIDRSYFYHLFDRVYDNFPQQIERMVALTFYYGGYDDIDYIYNFYRDKGTKQLEGIKQSDGIKHSEEVKKHTEAMTYVVHIYQKMIQCNCKVIFKDILENLTLEDVNEFKTKINKMSNIELKDLMKDKYIYPITKWVVTGSLGYEVLKILIYQHNKYLNEKDKDEFFEILVHIFIIIEPFRKTEDKEGVFICNWDDANQKDFNKENVDNCITIHPWYQLVKVLTSKTFNRVSILF